MNKPEIKQCFAVPQPILFMYASRAQMNPNEFMEKLGIVHGSLHTDLGGYILTRQQYMAMLYKAGIKKSEEILTEDEEKILTQIETATLIEELERRTRG